MRKRLKLWWFTKIVLPQVMKYPNEVLYCLVARIVEQQFLAGVPAAQINKWLVNLQHKTIKAYMRRPNGTFIIFYEKPSAERRAELDGNIVVVA